MLCGRRAAARNTELDRDTEKIGRRGTAKTSGRREASRSSVRRRRDEGKTGAKRLVFNGG